MEAMSNMNRFMNYKTTISYALTIIVLMSLGGCSFFAEEGIEKDRAEQKEILDGLFVTYWKGAKISIRSMPVDENTKSIDFEAIKKQQAKRLNLGKHLSNIYDWEDILKDSKAAEREVFTAKEFIEFAQEIYVMAEGIESSDEDDYPTFTEIVSHSNRVLKGQPIPFPKYWNNSMDHWMFALIMETRLSIGSWKTYELEKVKPQELVTSDYRVMAALHKGLHSLQNQWYYLADESFSQAISEASKSGAVLQPQTQELLRITNINGFSPEEQFGLVTRASAHLLRGFSRYQADGTDLNEQALGDIEAALADFHKLGIENDLVWIAESYLHISNEDKAKAIASLTKLEGSKYLPARERALIADIKAQVGDRDPDSVLNALTDKVIIYRLSVGYSMSYLTEIEWMQLLEKTEQGRKILQRFTELEQTYEKAKSHLDLDALKDKGQSLLEDLIK